MIEELSIRFGKRQLCEKIPLKTHLSRRKYRLASTVTARLSVVRPTVFTWRKCLWVLKNSLCVQNSRNLGDRKCPSDPRKSIVGLPDAISFLRISWEGVFQHPRLLSTVSRGFRRQVSCLHGFAAAIGYQPSRKKPYRDLEDSSVFAARSRHHCVPSGVVM
jgi:hypothetical protein